MSHKVNSKKSGKNVLIIDGEHKDLKGVIYNNESSRDAILRVYLDNGTNISISTDKCQIVGYFD